MNNWFSYSFLEFFVVLQSKSFICSFWNFLFSLLIKNKFIDKIKQNNEIELHNIDSTDNWNWGVQIVQKSYHFDPDQYHV